MIDTSPFPIKTFYLSLRRFPWKHLNMPHLLFLLWVFPWSRTFLAKLSGESVTPGWEACLHVAKGFSSGWAEVGHLCHLVSLKRLMRFALHLHHTSIHTLWSLKQFCKAAGASGEKRKWEWGILPPSLEPPNGEPGSDTSPSPNYLHKNFLSWASLG